MLIPVAMQQAKSAAASIGALVRGGQARPFRYSDPGIMATIGRNQGVAQIHGVKLSGFLGWLMWLAVHLVNVLSFRNRLVVLIDWAWEYFLYDRPVRLILRAAPATPSVPSSAAEEAGAGPGPAPARRARRASSSRSR
jgi:NADH dehydrogenase